MARKSELFSTEPEIAWFDLRIIDRTGVFHVHHDGDKASARERARRMAEYHWPKADGYRHKWSGDSVVVFKGKQHVGDVAVEPLEHTPEDDAA